MTFLAPAWLWLLPLAAVPFVWPRTGRAALGGRALWRALVVALIVFGLARPAHIGTTERPQVFVLVDRSSSVDFSAGPTLADLDARIATAAEAFGEDADVEVRAFDHSLLGAALADAASSLEAGRAAGVVLVTDGRARDATAPAALARLAARDVPVHLVELPARDVARFEGLGTTPGADGLADPRFAPRVGAPLTLHTTLHNPGPAGDVVLEYTSAKGSIELARTAFPANTTSAVRFDVEPAGDMFGQGELVVSLVDSEGVRTRLARPLDVGGPRAVLYLGTHGDAARAEWDALVGAGFALVEPAEVGLAKDGLTRADLAAFDLVVLDDQPAAGLGDKTLAALDVAVREDGLGLFAAGGERAFGPGGWHETTIEELLPVELVQKEEKRDPSTTLVVIIDTSGSMGGQRVQLAKEVARLAIRRLLPHDKVGIVEFYGAKQWAAPIQPASNAIEIERALNRLTAGGGTVILPAIEEAYYGLKNVRTRYKHVMILTDGGVETGAFEPMLRSMAEDGINVSTVLIGGNAHSEFLVTLANWGKGRFYSVPNRFNLPEIILKQPTTAKLPALRPGPHVLDPRGGAYWWGAAFEPEGEPLVVDAYVETRLRPGASALLESRTEGHPVVATWALGQGRVTTLTTDLTGPSTQAWGAAERLAPLVPLFARLFEETRTAERAREVHVAVEGALTRAETRWSASARAANAPASQVEARVVAPSEASSWRALPGASAPVLVPAAWAGELDTPPARWLAFDDPALRVAGGDHFAYADWSPTWRPRTGTGRATPELVALWPLAFVLALLGYLAEVLWRRSSFAHRP